MNRLDACIRTRQIAATTLAEALQELLAGPKPISEIDLRDLWLAKLRTHEAVFPDGWYTPPPHGMFVQFGTDTDPSRVMHESNRPPDAWPRADIFLDRHIGLLSAYASPVDRETGMIGDFGITLYFGGNPEIKALLKQVLEIDVALFDSLHMGDTLGDLARRSAALMASSGLRNAVSSVNDPAGTNIGHTFPVSDTGWSEAEMSIIQGTDWAKAAKMIADKRLFVSTAESTPITANMAHTIEPRPLVTGRPELPMISLHTVVIWGDGKKQHITGFDELFALAGMSYMH